MGAFWFIVIGIAVYMVIYALEWSWNYVEVSPMIVDHDNQVKLKEQTDQIAALTGQLETSSAIKQVKVALAALMKEGKHIEERMVTNQNSHEFSTLSQQLTDWVSRTADALIEFDLHTDAEVFRHSGERPSDQQTRAIPAYIQSWKRHDMSRFSVYWQTLVEIKNRNNL